MKRREFRSDTMTMPTAKMRDAMRDAEVGDDVCNEDPTVNRLQEMAAEILGKEAALFVPSGTCGNQCAIGVHTRPGNEVILSETVHVIDHEGGASAALWGAQTRVVRPGVTTYITAKDIASRLRLVDDVHEPDTGLVILENALADGTVMPLSEMIKVKELVSKYSIPVHLDGARLFNAAVALNIDPKQIADQADSLTFCLSKGLGAPVGSLLCGTTGFINQARRARKMLGGGMRQAGVLAAPGIVALTDGVKRLHEDHDNASKLVESLANIPGMVVEPGSVQINLVFCHVKKDDRTEGGLVEHLDARGFNSYPPAYYGLRFVTSSEVDADDVQALVEAVAEYMK
jgi:threonine aldolase